MGSIKTWGERGYTGPTRTWQFVQRAAKPLDIVRRVLCSDPCSVAAVWSLNTGRREGRCMGRLLLVYRQDGDPDEGDSPEKWREMGEIGVWLATETGLWVG